MATETQRDNAPSGELAAVEAQIAEVAAELAEVKGKITLVEAALSESGAYLGITERPELLTEKRAIEEERKQLRERQNELERQKTSLLARQQPAAPAKLIYRVTAAVKGAKKRVGMRGAVYKMAEQHIAYHEADPAQSIKYGGGGDPDGLGHDDLSISVVFEEKTKAAEFQTALRHWYFNQPLVMNREDVSVGKMQMVHAEAGELQRVVFSEYDTSQSDSPEQTLAAIQGPRHSSDAGSPDLSVASLQDDIGRFQRLENAAVFVELHPYRCHIVGKKQDRELANSANNILAASWQFHQYFDGLHTVSRMPQLVVEFLSHVREEALGQDGPHPPKRQRVEVKIECRTEETAASLHLKEGSERLDSKTWKSFLYVQDAEVFRDCLARKSMETRRIWADST